MRPGRRHNHLTCGNDKFAALISHVENFVFHVLLHFPGGIARPKKAHAAAQPSQALRSRLAEHGAKRRADGLDGENRVPSWGRSGKTVRSQSHLRSRWELSRALLSLSGRTKKGKERPVETPLPIKGAALRQLKPLRPNPKDRC